ncbi:MAG: cation-transporting P-type ATPase [Anaerolineae bacterium]|nr:cation-transporting P-type ATPase [Anaerolineae bacterium]
MSRPRVVVPLHPPETEPRPARASLPDPQSSDPPIASRAIPDVYQALETSPQGLTLAEAQARLTRYGRNALQEVHGVPLWVKFLANFTHLMAWLLWAGGLVAFIAQLPQLGIAIWMVNVINGAFSFWQEFKAERATEALKRLLSPYARIVRQGEEQRLPAEEIVPGDLLLLAEGDRVAADGRLVQAAELRVDQSTLSGEADAVRKTADAVTRTDLATVEMPNLVFAGTSVAAGTGQAVVVATGMRTEFGRIAHFTQSVAEEPSPLQRELGRVTKQVTVIAVVMGLVFFGLAVLLARVTLAESFIFALGMIVAFVPEGLLPTVTLALAMGVQRMARRHALVKRLSAVETLGCATVICTDKTGTLTQNEMTVRALWLPGAAYTVSGVGYAPDGAISSVTPSDNDSSLDLRQLLLAAGLCNNARLLPPNAETPRWTILGDPTEAALRVVAAKGGLDLDTEMRTLPRWREIPFESRRKRMTTLHRVTGEESGLIAYVKGAPKEIVALCSQVWRRGQAVPLDDTQRQAILAANDDYARQGLRVLALAMRAVPASLPQYTPETVETELVFLGLAAMMDPPRPEVSEAVAKCHRAGIRIIMITGDYGLTAESIARRIGILRGPQPRILTGADLDTLDDAALQAAMTDEVIFARVAPEHKLRVVAALQTLGHIVAVTGDGVNDAPALKKADIGVAMGQAGTDVAKEAADMILTDDNFASIVNAIEEGRAVYANIKKFTTYIFTSNTPEAVPFILFVLSGGRIPLALNVMHVLAVDLGTDMAPALALGAEVPEPGTMDRPPRSLHEHVITPGLLARAYLFLGPLQSLAVMAAFYFQYWTNGYRGQWLDLPAQGDLYRAATAMALAAVVMTQIGNLFAQRTERLSVFRLSWFSNRLVWLGIAVEMVLIVLIVYAPPFQAFVGTAAFPASHWLFLLAWTPLLLLADEARKAWGRRRERGAVCDSSS